jgi:hypothetical protein
MCQRFIVGPQRDDEAVTLVDAWLHSRLQGRHRTLVVGEPLSELDFEWGDVMPYMRHSGKDIARQ